MGRGRAAAAGRAPARTPKSVRCAFSPTFNDSSVIARRTFGKLPGKVAPLRGPRSRGPAPGAAGPRRCAGGAAVLRGTRRNRGASLNAGGQGAAEGWKPFFFLHPSRKAVPRPRGAAREARWAAAARALPAVQVWAPAAQEVAELAGEKCCLALAAQARKSAPRGARRTQELRRASPTRALPVVEAWAPAAQAPAETPNSCNGPKLFR